MHEGTSGLQLIAYRGSGGCEVWTRGQATYRLRRGLSVVAEACERKGRPGRSRLIPEEFARHSGRIKDGMRLTAMEATGREVVVQRVYGVREVEHGRSMMCIASIVGKERAHEVARSMNEVGI